MIFNRGIDTVKITVLSNHKPGILNNYSRMKTIYFLNIVYCYSILKVYWRHSLCKHIIYTLYIIFGGETNSVLNSSSTLRVKRLEGQIILIHT
jgi:hypothetical protein